MASMKDQPTGESRHFDFLTQLLGDELFKENETIMIDEILTFIGASTQTTSLLLTNVLYFLSKSQDVKDKCMQEIKEKLLSKLPKDADLSKDTTWHELLLAEDNVDSCPFMLQCIYETLRIDSSATVSTSVRVTEETIINDKKILPETKILIVM